jgi:hypothetical protein
VAVGVDLLRFNRREKWLMGRREPRKRNVQERPFHFLLGVAERLGYPDPPSDLVRVFEACLYEDKWPDAGWYNDDRIHSLYKLIHFPELFEITPETLAVASGLWLHYTARATAVDENEDLALLNVALMCNKLPVDMIAPLVSLLMRIWVKKSQRASSIYGLALAIVFHDIGQRCAVLAADSAQKLPERPSENTLEGRLSLVSTSLANRSEWQAAIKARPGIAESIGRMEK